MSVNHRRGNVVVPQKFLDDTNTVSAFKQVRDKAVSRRVTACCFGNVRLLDCEFDSVVLKEAFVGADRVMKEDGKRDSKDRSVVHSIEVT
jgi:hypothetical protein